MSARGCDAAAAAAAAAASSSAAATQERRPAASAIDVVAGVKTPPATDTALAFSTRSPDAADRESEEERATARGEEKEEAAPVADEGEEEEEEDDDEDQEVKLRDQQQQLSRQEEARSPSSSCSPPLPPDSGRGSAAAAVSLANGQRRYGGPPPGWTGPPPPRGCEVFVGKIPRDCYEDELVPVFERAGRVYELRLMMDFGGSNRGYAFVTYASPRDAQAAVRELNNYEIRRGRSLGVCRSVDNCRLFVGGIPKSKTKAEILAEIRKVTDSVVDVIVYPSATDKSKNRGFAFVEYESHRAAAVARRKLIPGKIQLWGHQIAVDWAEPEVEVDEEVMQQVKILYVRNLMLSTTEDRIRQVFTQAAGKDNVIERVKKIRDYAFVHFTDREDACRVMRTLNGSDLDGAIVEVVLAKPADRVDGRRGGRAKTNSGNVRHAVAGRPDVPQQNGVVHSLAYDQALLGAFYSQLSFSANASPYLPAAAPGVQHLAGVPVSARGQIHGGGVVGGGSGGGGGRSGRSHTRTGRGERGSGSALRTATRGHSPAEILEELCIRNGWTQPTYQHHLISCRAGNANDGEVLQLFIGRAIIHSLMGLVPGGMFASHRPSRTAEEAKQAAAECVLACLGFIAPGMEAPMLALPHPPPVAAYHGHQMVGPSAAPTAPTPPYAMLVPTEHGYAYVSMPHFSPMPMPPPAVPPIPGAVTQPPAVQQQQQHQAPLQQQQHQQQQQQQQQHMVAAASAAVPPLQVPATNVISGDQTFDPAAHGVYAMASTQYQPYA